MLFLNSYLIDEGRGVLQYQNWVVEAGGDTQNGVQYSREPITPKEVLLENVVSEVNTTPACAR